MRFIKFLKKKIKPKSKNGVELCRELQKSVGLSFGTRKKIQQLLDEENEKEQ